MLLTPWAGEGRQMCHTSPALCLHPRTRDWPILKQKFLRKKQKTTPQSLTGNRDNNLSTPGSLGSVVMLSMALTFLEPSVSRSSVTREKVFQLSSGLYTSPLKYVFHLYLFTCFINCITIISLVFFKVSFRQFLLFFDTLEVYYIHFIVFS